MPFSNRLLKRDYKALLHSMHLPSFTLFCVFIELYDVYTQHCTELQNNMQNMTYTDLT